MHASNDPLYVQYNFQNAGHDDEPHVAIQSLWLLKDVAILSLLCRF